MADLLSAWEESGRVYLVTREGTKVVPSKWSMFVTGLDDDDRAAIARDPKVTGVKADGVHTRIDCSDRWRRKEIYEAIEKLATEQMRGDVQVLEADVSPIRRLLSDVPSLDVHPDPRLCYFDLETDSRKRFDEAKAGDAQVLCWSAVGSDGKKASGVLGDDLDETGLLKDLFRFFGEYDCCLAWNLDGFDLPVLEKRCEKLGIDIRWNRWTWLDHLEVFRKYNAHSDDGGEAKVSFKLGHVAQYLLGDGKHDFDASKTWEAWQAGGEAREKLLRYNEQDAALLPRIEEKTGFLALHLAVCHVCRVFPDTLSLNATQQGDGFLLRLGAERGYRWPTKLPVEDEPAKFKGAFVMDPTKTGIVENVHVADFAGLYPSIMRTWNMSLETKAKGPLRAGLCQLPNRNTFFRSDVDGMFRIALDRLVAQRGEYTAEMKRHAPGTPEHARSKRLSGAFKIVANSFYGICGSPFSRFFDVDIAEGVTQTGRWLIEQCIEETSKSGLDPFYCDTDSVWAAGDRGKFSEVIKRLNASWSDRLKPWGIDRHHIDLDFEKTFGRVVMVSAKRYAGRYAVYKGKEASPDAKPEVKGLEFKRGDSIRLAREMQSEVIDRFLKEGPVPLSEQMRLIVARWRTRVLEGELTLEDVVLSQSLTKAPSAYGKGGKGVPTHARVALEMARRGESVGEGSRVSYVVVGSKGKLEAVPASDPGAIDRIDRKYYWERRVYEPTRRVLEKVYPALEWGEVKKTSRQRQPKPDTEQAKASDQMELAIGGGTVRRRRKKAEEKRVTVVLVESSAVEDGGAEAHRRKLTLEAIRAAAEANPGPVPLDVVVTWKRTDGDRQVKVRIPTGLKVAQTATVKRAFERVLSPHDQISGL